MILQKQRVVSDTIGDCFPACMATLMELPLEVMPNDHSDAWYSIWKVFLSQFGLDIQSGGSKDAIWLSHPWIATVKSKNYKGGAHAIVMNGTKVVFDPSTKKIYKEGTDLLSKDVVLGGYKITVADFSKIHKLKEYREKITKQDHEAKKENQA